VLHVFPASAVLIFNILCKFYGTSLNELEKFVEFPGIFSRVVLNDADDDK